MKTIKDNDLQAIVAALETAELELEQAAEAVETDDERASLLKQRAKLLQALDYAHSALDAPDAPAVHFAVGPLPPAA